MKHLFLLCCVLAFILRASSELWMMDEEFHNFTCGEQWLCSYNRTDDDTTPRQGMATICSCQENCRYFEDCCSDFKSPRDTGHFDYDSIARKYVSCTWKERVSSLGFYSINRCPDNLGNTSLSYLCETSNESDILIDLPVMGIKSGHFFKNAFCAMCHNELFQYWILSVSCSENSDLLPNSTLREAMKDRHCYSHYMPPENTSLHFCEQMNPFAKECPSNYSGSDMDTGCKTELSRPVFTELGFAKNKYCAACNMFEPLCKSKLVKYSIFKIYSFSILMDINTGSGSTVGINTNVAESQTKVLYACPEREVYDPFSGSCRSVICAANLVYTNGACVPHSTDTMLPSSSGKRNHTNSSVAVGGTTDFIDSSLLTNLTNDCPRVRLNKTEFTIQKDGTLLETQSSILHQSSQFLLKDDFALVCSNLSRFYSTFLTSRSIITNFNFSETESVVSFVGILLSLIGLFITVLVYSVFPSLRNVPGRIIISLSTSLFLAELLLLIAPSAETDSKVCIPLAISIHYLFLAAFFWMNVTALNIYLTFGKTLNNSSLNSHSHRFIKFSFYAWLTPLVIIGIAISFNYLDIQGYNPNYGDGICWITNKNALLVFFITPLGIILFLNIIFFTIATYRIWLAKRQSVLVLGKGDRQDLCIYLKLSVVVGLTWLFGFLAQGVSHVAIWYVYIVLNTLQGVFICLSFVCSRRVFRLIRGKCACRENYGHSTDIHMQTVSCTYASHSVRT